WPVPWVDRKNPSPWVPHKIALMVQLIALPALMFIYIRSGYGNPKLAITVCWAAFFITALVCHGELAADRPPPQFLTEFYLWMSVGGMVGGTFNALIAPLIPWFGLFEFPLAIVIAGIVRPRFKGEGWTDKLLGAYESPNGKSISLALDLTLPLLILALAYYAVSVPGGRVVNASDWTWNPDYLRDYDRYDPQVWDKLTQMNDSRNPLFRFAHKTLGRSGPSAFNFSKVMFIVLVYGLPIGCALLAWKRPLRMGLGLGAVLLASGLYETRGETRPDHEVLYRDRSYFGILRVMQQSTADEQKGLKAAVPCRWTYLMHGTTHHGLNYQYPDGTDFPL